AQLIATTTPKLSHNRPIATPPKAKPIIASDAEISLHERQSNRHRPRADTADGADRDRKSNPPPCRRRVDLAKLPIAQIHGSTRQRIHDAALSGPACVVNPARSLGYSSPIVMSVNDFTLFRLQKGSLFLLRVRAAENSSTGSHAPTYPRFRRDADNGNVSGTAVRNRDVNRDHPHVRRSSDHRQPLWDRRARSRCQPRPSACPFDHRPSQTSLGPREKNRAAPSSIFFKTRKRFCGSRKAKAFPLGRAMSVVVGNSEVSERCGQNFLKI